MSKASGMKMEWRGDRWVEVVFSKGVLIEFTLDEFRKLEAVKYAASLVVAEATGADLGEQLLLGMSNSAKSH